MTLKRDYFSTINPVDSSLIKKYEFASDSLINSSLNNLEKSLLPTYSLSKKKLLLNQIKDQFIIQKEKLAQQITQEMGKPIIDSRAEVEKTILAFDYVIEQTDKYLTTEKVQITHSNSNKLNTNSDDSDEYQIVYSPMGIVLAIMPWNFPVWQLMRILPQSIAVGNRLILKPALEVAGVGMLMRDIIHAVTKEAFDCLLLDHDQTKKLISDPRIAAVTITGSTAAGKEVAKSCGEALKKCVTELGGSDPYIVFEDADLNKTTEHCVKSKLINNGQSCIAAKRFIVDKNILSQFLELFKAKILDYKIGNPNLDGTQLGPLAGEKHKTNLLEKRQLLIDYGAISFWRYPDSSIFSDSRACFVQPEILVLPETYSKELIKTLKDIELFGPIAIVETFSTLDEAINKANQTSYGLGSAFFTQKKEIAEVVVSRVQAGTVVQNDFVKSHPALPFGGIKQSGFGRELGKVGFFEFVNIQTIRVET